MPGSDCVRPVYLCLGLFLAVGCSDPGASGPQFETRKTGKVHGKVTFNGQAVTSGSVSFSPISSGGNAAHAGKAGSGPIEPDGTYTISTYSPGDGAVLGQHKVSVGETDPMKPLPGLTPPDLKTEVKEGDNELNIELAPRKK